jgi:hypothetical protein
VRHCSLSESFSLPGVVPSHPGPGPEPIGLTIQFVGTLGLICDLWDFGLSDFGKTLCFIKDYISQRFRPPIFSLGLTSQSSS